MDMTAHEMSLLKVAMIRRAMGWPAKPALSPYAIGSLIEQDLDQLLARTDESTRAKWFKEYRELYLLECARPITRELGAFISDFVISNERNPTRAELDAHMYRCFPRNWKHE